MEMPSGLCSSAPTPPRAPGQGPEQRRHRGHHDRAEAHDAGAMDGLLRAQALAPLDFQGEIDHHDGILLHDAMSRMMPMIPTTSKS